MIHLDHLQCKETILLLFTAESTFSFQILEIRPIVYSRVMTPNITFNWKLKLLINSAKYTSSSQ
jgi:hypothetical protein